MDPRWQPLLEELMGRFGFEFATAMDLSSRDALRVGSTPTLHNNGLAFQLAGDAESWENLFDSMRGSTEPRLWEQGAYRAWCFNYTDQVLIVMVGRSSNPLEDYRGMQAVHQKLLERVKAWT